MNHKTHTIHCVVSVSQDVVTPVVAYEDAFDAQRKAAELNRNRLAGDKAQYAVHSIELVGEK